MAGHYDKVRVLQSEDVQHGRAQYFQHVAQDTRSDPSALPYAQNPFRSGQSVQHLVAFRSKDTKPLGVGHPDYGYTGRVFIQEAFDNKGRLRRRPGEETAGAGPIAQSVPSDESGGSIFVYIGGRKGECKVADSVEIVRSVPVPYSKYKPTLSERLSKASALDLSLTMQDKHPAVPPNSAPKMQQSTPKSDKRIQAGAMSAPGSAVGRASADEHEYVLSISSPDFHSPAHRRLFSSEGAGPQYAGDKLMENIRAIFEEKAPGQARIPITLCSQLGKMAMTSGEIGLEGCGMVETPFTTARSTVAGTLDNTADMAAVDEILRDASPAKPTISKALARLSQAGGSQVADSFIQRQRELDDKEKELKLKASELKADVGRRARRIQALENDIKQREKEEADAHKLLHDLLSELDPLRKQMAEVNYRVDAQRKILEKYKAEHGEKGIYKTLRTEIKDELNVFQDVKDNIAKLEPKEKSKRKQYDEKHQATEETKRDCEKMQAKLEEIQKLSNGAKAELRSFLNMKKEGLAEVAKGSSPIQSTASPLPVLAHARREGGREGASAVTGADKTSFSFSKRGHGHEKDGRKSLEDFDFDSILEQEKSASAAHGSPLETAHGPALLSAEGKSWPQVEAEKAEKEEGATEGAALADPNVHKTFCNAGSWIRRYALAARAASPRWRTRLVNEVHMWKMMNVDKTAMKPKYAGTEPLLGPPASSFIARIQMPCQLSTRFQTYCRKPSHPFEPCISYEVVFETRSMQHVEVTIHDSSTFDSSTFIMMNHGRVVHS